MSKKYYIEICFNVDDHYTVNKYPNSNNKNCVYACVREGIAPDFYQEMQFFTQQLQNGFYKHYLKKSEIKFVQISYNNKQLQLTEEQLEQVLYNDYFSNNNNAYFNNYKLNSISKENDVFILSISNITKQKKIYGIVECIKGCNGYFTKNNYCYKDYEIMQLDNSIIEFLPLTFLENDLIICCKQETNDFIDCLNQTHLENYNAYEIKSEGAYKQLYNNMIFDSYQLALSALPQKQKFHQQLFLQKTKTNLKTYGLSIDVPFVSSYQMIYKKEEDFTVYNKKDSVEEISFILMNNSINNQIDYIDMCFNKISELETGYYKIVDNNNVVYGCGKIENYTRLQIQTFPCFITQGKELMLSDVQINLSKIEKQQQKFNLIDNSDKLVPYKIVYKTIQYVEIQDEYEKFTDYIEKEKESIKSFYFTPNNPQWKITPYINEENSQV